MPRQLRTVGVHWIVLPGQPGAVVWKGNFGIKTALWYLHESVIVFLEMDAYNAATNEKYHFRRFDRLHLSTKDLLVIVALCLRNYRF